MDLAPTLSLLFGTPIPKNNIGVVLPEVFNSLTGESILTFCFQFLALHQDAGYFIKKFKIFDACRLYNDFNR